MAKIEVNCKMNTYSDSDESELKVSSDPHYKDLVVLEIGNKFVIVSAKNLKDAIDNCTNVGL